MDILIRGILLGFSIAAPVGPIGVLCIRRTLADGRAHGFASGLGAATADAFYGSLGAFGVTFLSGLLISGQDWLKLVGGLFLLYLGFKTFTARPAEKSAEAKSGRGLVGAYVSTLLLTLTNPATIIMFAAVFAGLGVGGQTGDYTGAVILVVGVFTGSALWWLLLSGGVSLFRNRFDVRAMTWINRLSGVIILAFGIVALVSIVAR